MHDEPPHHWWTDSHNTQLISDRSLADSQSESSSESPALQLTLKGQVRGQRSSTCRSLVFQHEGHQITKRNNIRTNIVILMLMQLPNSTKWQTTLAENIVQYMINISELHMESNVQTELYRYTHKTSLHPNHRCSYSS